MVKQVQGKSLKAGSWTQRQRPGAVVSGTHVKASGSCNYYSVRTSSSNEKTVKHRGDFVIQEDGRIIAHKKK